MVKKDLPVIRLIGKLRLRGTDWSLAEYRGLFPKLESIAETGKVTRYIRYSGEIGGHTKLRFFGVESGSQDIPKGMVGLELGNDAFTLLSPGQKIWQGKLSWNWLDRTVPGAPVGEFKAEVPQEWIPRAIPSPVDFVLTANAYFKKGKSADDNVRLAEYDPSWPKQYKAMETRLRKTIPSDILLRAEHFGSTAIPGMPAKPVIDILLEIPSFEKARKALIPLFNKHECEYWWQEDHMTFIVRKEFLGTRVHHIHAAPAGRFWERIAFRDYLRAHPEDAKRYTALKRKLAEHFATDREEYTLAKSKFVKEVTTKAIQNKP